MMNSPAKTFRSLGERCKKTWKIAFCSAFLIGLLNHLPIMLRDIPNHDGLASMYFDQNMITSGRWFLTVACGFSSYFTIPWLIGLLGILFLSLTAVILTDFLEITENWAIVLVSGLLMVFPSLSSTFCYVFTMDGYMMAVLLAVSAVQVTKCYPKGFLMGAVLLAFSLGIYQAYLPFAMLLCLYSFLFHGKTEHKEKITLALRYVLMGGIGLALYYGLLQVLLAIQGKELSNYQGINGMATVEKESLGAIIVKMYRDFLAFTVKGNVFTGNVFSKVVMVLLLLIWAIALLRRMVRRSYYRRPEFYGCLLVAGIAIPILSNIMLLISPGVNYHILMRYQYVLFPIFAITTLGNGAGEGESAPKAKNTVSQTIANGNAIFQWIALVCGVVLVFTYVVTDQIAYSNLMKKYEKTYSYCERLLDRIEQTEGYYQGIPIAMIGVVGNESYPSTDLTTEVTDGMIGMGGDYLLYTGPNYASFIQNYLGASLNILPADAMQDAYYAPFYREMESFPAADSIRIVDGILYIKTENKE